ncbi:MAG: hypothetical protein C4292_06910 [Nitrososphaera sp.]
MISWACQAAPDLAPHLIALAALESGFRPDAIANTACPNLPGYRPPRPGDYPELSVGLLQHNTCGGLGGSSCCNISQEELAALTDPVENLRRGAEAIRSTLNTTGDIYAALRPWYNARNILYREGWFVGEQPNPCQTVDGSAGNGAGTNFNVTLLVGAAVLMLLLLEAM